MEPSEKQARAIQQHKENLEEQIRTVLREYERQHGGPLAVELAFADDMPGGAAPEELKARVQSVVEAFHDQSAVSESGIRVQKVTAMDSDADGTIAIEVEYDYPGYV